MKLDDNMEWYLCFQVGRHENAIGWYHSHPGYGCWLSGIDVSTQMLNQNFQEPFVAIVIDPVRTISAGKVCLGAFRTYPKVNRIFDVELHILPLATKYFFTAKDLTTLFPVQQWDKINRKHLIFLSSCSILSILLQGYKPANEEPSEYQTIPLNKIEDFGVHCKQYYSLEVSYFKSSLDRRLLNSLWNKYWVNTLSSSSLITNADYTTGQIFDLSDKLEQSEACLGEFAFSIYFETSFGLLEVL